MASTLPDARAWTPACAVRDGRLTARMLGLAEAWVRNWFPEPTRPSLAIDLGLASRRAGENDLCWRADGLVLVISRRGLAAMGAMMAAYSNPTARAEDDAILQSVAEPGVAELWSSIMTLFAAEETLPRAVGASLDMAARVACRFGDCAFELFVSPHRLAAARQAIATPLKRLAPLRDRTEALARQSLDLSVLVGGARLGLQEVKALAIGDVIVLDRNTREDLDLLIEGNLAADIHCRLDHDGDHLGIHITEPLSPAD